MTEYSHRGCTVPDVKRSRGLQVVATDAIAQNVTAEAGNRNTGRGCIVSAGM